MITILNTIYAAKYTRKVAMITKRNFYLGAVNSKPVWGVLQIYRIECENCNIVTEEQRISDNKKSYSTEIGKVVVNYTQYLDNNLTTKLLRLSEIMVYRICR